MSNINPYIHDFTVDLRNGVTIERAKKPLSQGDAFANKIVVHVLKDGQTVPLDGVAVSASVIRYDGATVPLTGTVEEGAACIVLNDECYAVPGDLLVSVVLAVGEVKQTILRLMLNVETSQTDIIADGGVIGSFSQLLAEIENMRSATAAAISAAERAEAAADKAEGIAPGGGGTGTVTSVNGVEPDEEGNVQITIPEVPAWAMAATKPTYTAKEVGADPAGTAASKVSTHNADEEAHPAIRQLISDLSGRLSALADSDDTTLDQLSEIVAYIKSNKSLIDSITTGKVSVSDIVNNLTSTATNKPLSAAQGKALKALIDAIAVPTKLSELAEDTTHRVVTDAEKTAWNAKSTFSGKYADLTGKPTKVTAFENDAGYLTEHQDISHLLPRTELGTAVDVALAEAKASGAFDGEDGKDGKTPVAGVDYYTPEDKSEFTEYIAAELAKRGQLKPEFASSKDECTDPGKLYVLPDGYIYVITSREVTTEDSTIANYTNMLTHADTEIKSGYRYSHSSSAFKALSGCMSVIIPIPTSGEITLRFRNCRYYSDSTGGTAYPQVYGGTSKTAFPTQYITAASGWNTDSNGDSYVTFSNTTGNTYITVGLNTYDQTSAVITINEEITETVIPGGTEIVTELVNTGLAFVPADYEPRIIKAEEDIADLDSRVKTLENTSNASALSMMVYAPSPQLPADGSETADFDATNITADEIYTYIDALVAKYPRYLTKEVLGKDTSGTFDWNRYTASRRTYDAWVKPTYPAMYAWVNGSTTIYSVSVSPRVGDTMYTMAYIGTAYSTVTAVDNANQTRTVNGLAFARNTSADIAPTLVYTYSDYNPYRLDANGGVTWRHNAVYNASRVSIGTIADMVNGTMTDSNGDVYTRYPMGDRNRNFKLLPAIVIGSNEHGGNEVGDPAEPAIITARLIKDLCENRYADNVFLNMLKTEYRVVFCPIINPWGYGKESGYVNANGVNLDRNFDTPGWGADVDTRHGAYGGSENETQYFMNTLYESGAKIALANHALGSHTTAETGEIANAGTVSYMLGRNDSKYDAHLLQISETMSTGWGLQMYDMGQAPGDTYGKTRSYMDYIGVEGGAVEMSAIDGYLLHGGARHTARILEADYTLLLQFLQMLIACQEG